MRAKDIIDVVNEYYGLTRGEIFEHNRLASVAEARKVAIFLVKKHTVHSWAEVSNMFYRDISTVRFAHRSVDTSTTEQGLRRRCLAIEQELKRRGLYDKETKAVLAFKSSDQIGVQA